MSKEIKQYIGFSNDHSASMNGITEAARKDYNANIAAIKGEAIRTGIDTIVSVLQCGVGSRVENIFSSTLSSIIALKPLDSYRADGHGTPLFDSVGMLIEQFKALPDANQQEVSFLVFVTTDGDENASKRWTGSSLGAEIRRLQATDRWTFVFRVPRGARRSLSATLGLPEGNIQEWEQTERGYQESTIATKSAVTEFYTARASGTRSVSSFYSDMSNVKPKEVKTKLDDISSEVTIWPVFPKDADSEIRPFVEGRLTTPYTKGAAFYELVKTERRIQATKMVVVQDKKTKMIYGGAAARQLLGLPDGQDVRMVPGNHGAFTVFIQSTSVNRKLPEGSNVLYWPKFGD